MKVGDTVVAIRDHSIKLFLKGQVFKIVGTRKGCCLNEVDVGIRTNREYQGCSICKQEEQKKNGITWFAQRCFVPIQDVSYKQVTFKEIQEPAICAN